MASDNARRFELRLGKLGLFMLICSLSGLVFGAFLFGVVVGSDLESYPEKIARRAPVRVLEWFGVLEAEKPKTVAVVIKNEKPVVRPAAEKPEEITPPVIPPLTSEQPNRERKTKEPSSVTGKVTEPSAIPAQAKVTTNADPKPSLKEKETPGDKYMVQITSCKNRKVAVEVVKDIGKIGYKAQIATVDLKEKGIWYRVVLTDLGNRDKAKEAAQKIDRILKGNKSVIRVQKR